MAKKPQTSSFSKETAMFSRIAGKGCTCNGTGQVVICGLCEENVRHSHCDDTHVIPCEHCQSKNSKQKPLKGGL